MPKHIWYIVLGVLGLEHVKQQRARSILSKQVSVHKGTTATGVTETESRPSR
jgi:hypothetical protein